MSRKIDSTKIITIGDRPIAVEHTSREVQELVALYDEYRQKASDYQFNYNLAAAAMRDVVRRIEQQVENEKQAAEQEAAEAAARAELSE